MKETTPEEVLKVMRHDSKKLDEQLNELEALRSNLRKAGEAITGAVIRYRKEKLKKKSLKAAIPARISAFTTSTPKRSRATNSARPAPSSLRS